MSADSKIAAQADGLRKELAAVKKDLAALRAAQSPSGAASSGSTTSLAEKSDGIDGKASKEELATAFAEVAALRKLDSRLRDHIAGGYPAALATAEAKRDALLA